MRYRLVIVSIPHAVPVSVRLRRMLKALLRAWGFRCESVVEVAQDARGAANIAKSTTDRAAG